jgi:hypothetical protein
LPVVSQAEQQVKTVSGCPGFPFGQRCVRQVDASTHPYLNADEQIFVPWSPVSLAKPFEPRGECAQVAQILVDMMVVGEASLLLHLLSVPQLLCLACVFCSW